MFLSLSKTLAKFGGVRLGLGLRMNKRNSIFVLFVMMFVWLFQLTWYMLVLCFWLMYAVCYGFYWCIKKIVQAIKARDTSRA